MPKIWTHAEVEEVKEKWKHPDTPIHVGEPISEEKWNRFVFFENVKDSFWVAIAVIGFVAFLFITFADLTKQHGIAVPISLVFAVIVVLLANRKRN